MKLDPRPEPTAIEKILDGYAPEELMGLVSDALHEMNSQIQNEELALHGAAQALVDATYQTSTRHDVYLNLGPPPGLDLQAQSYEERRHGVEVRDGDADVLEASYV